MENPENTYEKGYFWIACSGGLDSVFAARMFHRLNLSFGILHCNFHLRGQESDGDERFVRALATELGVPIRVKSFDVEEYKLNYKVNTQLAARQLRYTWFNDLVKMESAVIVLGHHRDDQRETFLLQLLRGASVHGLACMPLFRKGYFRPFLHLSKEQIREISEKLNWTWREDSSNKRDHYSRNDLRLNLLPELERKGINWREVDDLIASYQQLLAHINSLKIDVEKGQNTIRTSDWFILPKLLQYEFLEDIAFGKNNSDLVNQIANTTKGAFALRNGVELWNEGDFLLFRNQKDAKGREEPRLKIQKVNSTEVNFSSGDLYLDKDKVKGELYIRNWEHGDAFIPLGMKGKKKISDFLKDKKILISDKKNSLVLLDNQGIVGVLGYTPAERVKISSSSKQIIKVSVEYR